MSRLKSTGSALIEGARSVPAMRANKITAYLELLIVLHPYCNIDISDCSKKYSEKKQDSVKCFPTGGISSTLLVWMRDIRVEFDVTMFIDRA